MEDATGRRRAGEHDVPDPTPSTEPQQPPAQHDGKLRAVVENVRTRRAQRAAAKKPDLGVRRGLYAWVGMVAIALGLGAYWLWGAPGSNDQQCPKTRVGNLDPKSPQWRLVRPASTRVTIALEDTVERGRIARGAVRVRRIGRKGPRALPVHTKVGSFLREGSAARTEAWLQFNPATRAQRQPDGTLVAFWVCARRPDDLAENRAGIYRGAVRVAGAGISGVNVPVRITVKRDRRIAVTAAVLIALAGTLAAAGNSKPADIDLTWVKESRGLHELLWFLPMIGSVTAGAAAGIFIYYQDPAWGDTLGSDMGKLAAAALAGGTAAVTALAPVARSARRKAADRTAKNIGVT